MPSPIRSPPRRGSSARTSARPTGTRALLNLGHTFGHALEAEAGFADRLLHGEGVAAGMALAFGYSAARACARQTTPSASSRTCARSGCPHGSPQPGSRASGATLVGHMLHDKKMDAGTLPFLLAPRDRPDLSSTRLSTCRRSRRSSTAPDAQRRRESATCRRRSARRATGRSRGARNGRATGRKWSIVRMRAEEAVATSERAAASARYARAAPRQPQPARRSAARRRPASPRPSHFGAPSAIAYSVPAKIAAPARKHHAGPRAPICRATSAPMAWII